MIIFFDEPVAKKSSFLEGCNLIPEGLFLIIFLSVSLTPISKVIVISEAKRMDVVQSTQRYGFCWEFWVSYLLTWSWFTLAGSQVRFGSVHASRLQIKHPEQAKLLMYLLKLWINDVRRIFDFRGEDEHRPLRGLVSGILCCWSQALQSLVLLVPIARLMEGLRKSYLAKMSMLSAMATDCDCSNKNKLARKQTLRWSSWISIQFPWKCPLKFLQPKIEIFWVHH